MSAICSLELKSHRGYTAKTPLHCGMWLSPSDRCAVAARRSYQSSSLLPLKRVRGCQRAIARFRENVAGRMAPSRPPPPRRFRLPRKTLKKERAASRNPHVRTAARCKAWRGKPNWCSAFPGLNLKGVARFLKRGIYVLPQWEGVDSLQSPEDPPRSSSSTKEPSSRSLANSPANRAKRLTIEFASNCSRRNSDPQSARPSERDFQAVAQSKSYGMEEDLQGSRNCGFSSHLVKPVDFYQLNRALQEVVRKSDRKAS